jgi:hypothetical protein
VTAYLLWTRRCSAALASPAFVAVSLVILLTRRGWQFEWGWGLSQASSATVLLGPLLAGLVAFDRSRRAAPTVANLAASSPRSGLWALALASWMWAVAAWGLGMAVVAVVVTRNGARGWPDPWILVQPPAALLAAACLGLAWGATFRSIASAPIASVVVFLGIILGDYLGLTGLLASGRATGSLIGMQQVPAVAAAGIALNLMLALVALAWALHRIQPDRMDLKRLVMLGGAVTVAAAVGLARVGGGDTYRAVAEEQVCIGDGVVVCGPESARPVLAVAQSSLLSAVRQLGGSGVAWRSRYVWARGSDVFSIAADSGLLRVGTENISDGRMSPGEIASTLAMPRLCQDFFDPNPPDALLGKQGLVTAWVTEQLSQGSRAGRAPRQVLDAFDDLANCRPARAPS